MNLHRVRTDFAFALLIISMCSVASVVPSLGLVPEQVASSTIACGNGPPLAVSVTTDKPAYQIGKTVIVQMTANRPTEGILTISSPGGTPSTFSYVFYGPSYSATKTITVDTVGRYTVNLQADDFCTGFSSSVALFDVVQKTYDVSISLSGLPPQASVKLSVDGQNQGTIGGTEIRTLSFKVDTSHTVMVDPYVEVAGVQYSCSQNALSVVSAGSHTFIYSTQSVTATTTSTSTQLQTVSSTTIVTSAFTNPLTETTTTTSTSTQPQTPFVTSTPGVALTSVTPTAQSSVPVYALWILSSLFIIIGAAATYRFRMAIAKRPRTCAACGAVNPPYAKRFCVKCGEPLSNRKQ